MDIAQRSAPFEQEFLPKEISLESQQAHSPPNSLSKSVQSPAPSHAKQGRKVVPAERQVIPHHLELV
jgi:hypothetical protein